LFSSKEARSVKDFFLAGERGGYFLGYLEMVSVEVSGDLITNIFYIILGLNIHLGSGICPSGA
jgi:hypothetical protein